MTRLALYPSKRFALLCAVWMLACGSEPMPGSGMERIGDEPGGDPPSSAEPPASGEVLTPGLPPALPMPEPLGGQSGVEGGCELSETIEGVTPEQELDGFGYHLADVLAFVEGTHNTELRWAALDPPGTDASPEGLRVEVSRAGAARALRGCGNTFEVPVRYQLRSASGALELEGLSTLSANRLRGTFVASIPVESLPSWRSAAAPVLNLDAGATSFEIYLSFSADGTLLGSFNIRGTALCQLAAWPLSPTCDDGSAALDPAHPTQGERVSELFQRIEDLTLPQLSFSDGTLTDLSLSVSASPTTACTRRSIDGNGRPQPGDVYSAPVALKITTADGRIDVTIPAQASARWEAGTWSEPGFNTNGPVVAPSAGFGYLDLEPLGLTGRASLLLSASRAQGLLQVSSFAPRSPALRDVNPGCVSREFAGVLSEVLQSRWP